MLQLRAIDTDLDFSLEEVHLRGRRGRLDPLRAVPLEQAPRSCLRPRRSSSPSRWSPVSALLSEFDDEADLSVCRHRLAAGDLARRKTTLFAESLNTLDVGHVRRAVGVTGWIGEIGIRARDLRTE